MAKDGDFLAKPTRKTASLDLYHGHTVNLPPKPDRTTAYPGPKREG